jgi:hypothetical protein
MPIQVVGALAHTSTRKNSGSKNDVHCDPSKVNDDTNSLATYDQVVRGARRRRRNSASNAMPRGTAPPPANPTLQPAGAGATQVPCLVHSVLFGQLVPGEPTETQDV